MKSSSRFASDRISSLQVLWEDAERVFCRGKSHGDDATPVLAVLPAVQHPAPAVLDRLAHEYELRDELDDAWAARPLQLVREDGHTILMLKDPGGEPLDRLIGPPMEIGKFLRLAIALSVALGRLHRRGLVHKDIKPTNVLVNASADRVWLTGFGITSRLQRERPSPIAPESIEGTLAYMAPEQTGRMNRSINSRSDLYSLGVTLYQMLTGSLPFTASIDGVGSPPYCEEIRCLRAALRRFHRRSLQSLSKLLAKAGRSVIKLQQVSNTIFCIVLATCGGRSKTFPLGERDVPDRLLIPEKLYGRAHEIETLLASFDRVVNSGTVELLLVSGYSGIGKSSVVNELHKVLVPPRGLFASGKFDQYKRDIPYSTLAQAFQSLVRQLLGKCDLELDGWRDAFAKR